MKTINEAVAHLAKWRERARTNREEIHALEESLAGSDLGQRLARSRENQNNIKITAGTAEQDVRNMAAEIYAAVGEKAPHPAVRIKLYTVLGYDPQAALEFSAKHLPKTLKLDKRAFERAAKVIEPDFVTMSQEARATIARDLSKYMEEQ